MAFSLIWISRFPTPKPKKRDAANAMPASMALALPVVPHVGETDTDTLAETLTPPLQADVGDGEEEEEEEEGEVEFGNNWGEFLVTFINIFMIQTVSLHT